MKIEEKKYERRKKVFRLWLAIFLVINICVIVSLIKTKVKEYNKEYKFYNEISKEIEYQVGNHVSSGVYADGYTYVLTPGEILGHYDEAGEWIPQEYSVLCRVDKDGTYEEFCKFNNKEFELYFKKPYIYYYQGWLYLIARMPYEDKSDKIIRISKDKKYQEIIYESDDVSMFGIRDGYLIFSEDFEAFRVKLDVKPDFEKREKLKNNISSFFREYQYSFFSYWIYNFKIMQIIDKRKKNGVIDYSEFKESLRQYHNGNVYTLMQNEEYAGLDSYEHMDLVKRTFDESNTNKVEGKIFVLENKEEILINGVMCFNIFDDKLYYVTGSDGDNIVWRSDLNGENKEKLYQTDFEEKLYCKNMVVSDYNIVCDFGTDYKMGSIFFDRDVDEPSYRIMKRCIINNETGKVNTIEF